MKNKISKFVECGWKNVLRGVKETDALCQKKKK